MLLKIHQAVTVFAVVEQKRIKDKNAIQKWVPEFVTVCCPAIALDKQYGHVPPPSSLSLRSYVALEFRFDTRVTR